MLRVTLVGPLSQLLDSGRGNCKSWKIWWIQRLRGLAIPSLILPLGVSLRGELQLSGSNRPEECRRIICLNQKKHNPTKSAQARVLQNARLINWTSIREEAIPFSWRPSGIAAHSISNSKNSIADRHSCCVSPTVITRRRISWVMLVQGHDPHGLVSDIQDQLTSTPESWNFLLSAV